MLQLFAWDLSTLKCCNFKDRCFKTNKFIHDNKKNLNLLIGAICTNMGLVFIQQFTKRNNAAFIFCFQLTLIYNKTNISTKLMKLLRLALCFNDYLILLIMSLFINYDLRMCMVYF